MEINLKEESASEEGIAQKEEVIFQQILFKEEIVVQQREVFRFVIESFQGDGTLRQDSELVWLE